MFDFGFLNICINDPNNCYFKRGSEGEMEFSGVQNGSMDFPSSSSQLGALCSVPQLSSNWRLCVPFSFSLD